MVVVVVVEVEVVVWWWWWWRARREVVDSHQQRECEEGPVWRVVPPPDRHAHVPAVVVLRSSL